MASGSDIRMWTCNGDPLATVNALSAPRAPVLTFPGRGSAVGGGGGTGGVRGAAMGGRRTKTEDEKGLLGKGASSNDGSNNSASSSGSGNGCVLVYPPSVSLGRVTAVCLTRCHEWQDGVVMVTGHENGIIGLWCFGDDGLASGGGGGGLGGRSGSGGSSVNDSRGGSFDGSGSFSSVSGSFSGIGRGGDGGE